MPSPTGCGDRVLVGGVGQRLAGVQVVQRVRLAARRLGRVEHDHLRLRVPVADDLVALGLEVGGVERVLGDHHVDVTGQQRIGAAAGVGHDLERRSRPGGAGPAASRSAFLMTERWSPGIHSLEREGPGADRLLVALVLGDERGRRLLERQGARQVAVRERGPGLGDREPRPSSASTATASVMSALDHLARDEPVDGVHRVHDDRGGVELLAVLEGDAVAELHLPLGEGRRSGSTTWPATARACRRPPSRPATRAWTRP